jgi:polar amino acid transport system permease protein
MYNWQFGIIFNYVPAIVTGFVYTILLSIAIIPVGTVLGVGVAVCLQYGRPGVRRVARYVCEFFIAMPVLVLIFWAYYCLPLVGIFMSAYWTCVIAMSLSLSAFIAILVKAGIEAIPKSQLDVAEVFGFSQWEILTRIILPQVRRFLLSPILFEYVTTVKLTTVCSMLSVPEILYNANLIITQTYRAFEVYTLVALLFVAIVMPLRVIGHAHDKQQRWFVQ